MFKKKHLPMIVILAEEVKSGQGDILALNIKEPIPDHLPGSEVLKRIKRPGRV